MEKGREKIAVTKNGKDHNRIIPFGSEENKDQIKISFIDKSFIVRRFTLNKGEGELLYIPTDFGLVSDEITYHNSTKIHSTATLLTKLKGSSERVPILKEIIDLDLRNLIVPIPICRITINRESDELYSKKDIHNNINLCSKYNTTEIYVSSAKYDSENLAKRFPHIVEYLFPISTVDFIVYGAGVGSIPIMMKMSEFKPITALESDLIGNYRFYYRTYELPKTNSFFLYSDEEYSHNNFIEFFNNVDYLDLLAITNIGFKIKGTESYEVLPAYKRDVEHLKKTGFHKDYIKRLNRRFYAKEAELKKLKKFRSGIIFN